MNSELRIKAIRANLIQQDYWSVKVILQNLGTERVGPGQVLATQATKDGSVQPIEFFSRLQIAPGETVGLSQFLRGSLKEIHFKSYRTKEGLSIPLSGSAKRGFFRWSFNAA